MTLAPTAWRAPLRSQAPAHLASTVPPTSPTPSHPTNPQPSGHMAVNRYVMVCKMVVSRKFADFLCCHIKLVFLLTYAYVLYCIKLAFLLTFNMFGSCFRTLAVILVSDFCVWYIVWEIVTPFIRCLTYCRSHAQRVHSPTCQRHLM